MDITGIGSALDFAGGLLDRFWPKSASLEEKAKAVSAIAPLIQERDDGVVKAKRDVMIAELNQGDTYTKRARPSVIYGGLVFIGLNYVIFPGMIKIMVAVALVFGTAEALATAKAMASELSGLTKLELPAGFWAAWGGISGVWAISRTAERRGSTNKLIQMITGGTK